MIQNKRADRSEQELLADLQRRLQKAREAKVRRTVLMAVSFIVGAVLTFEYWPLGLVVLAAGLYLLLTRSRDDDRIEAVEGEILLTQLTAAAENATANGQEPATGGQLRQAVKLLVEVGASRRIELGVGDNGRPTFSTERAAELIRELQAERDAQGENSGRDGSGQQGRE